MALLRPETGGSFFSRALGRTREERINDAETKAVREQVVAAAHVLSAAAHLSTDPRFRGEVIHALHVTRNAACLRQERVLQGPLGPLNDNEEPVKSDWERETGRFREGFSQAAMRHFVEKLEAEANLNDKESSVAYAAFARKKFSL